jgi:hypothetical protein
VARTGEINLSLEQARMMGELPRVEPDGPGYALLIGGPLAAFGTKFE